MSKLQHLNNTSSFDPTPYDVIVIGAGFSGAVMAERFASQLNKKVAVIEQRQHIAGNCFDKLDSNGVRIHQYGPHLFHTSNQDVWDYLQTFGEWQTYEHKVVAEIDGKLLPVPFNLNSLDAAFPAEQAQHLTKLLVDQYGFNARVPILELKKTDSIELKALADFVYEKLFVNYTCKQWGCSPEQISSKVTARVPVVISRDDRYFQDTYQAVPTKGYTDLVNNMLLHENIDVYTHIDAKEILAINGHNQIVFNGEIYGGIVVYTGMLDELFDFEFGSLSYRSLRFTFEQLSMECYQSHTTVNFPNEHDYTRITEFKHIHVQQLPSTTIVKEYPQEFDRNDSERNIPYYPVFNQRQIEAHGCYLEKAKKVNNLVTLGRLAEFKYFNMDDAIANALSRFDSLKKPN